MSNLILPDLPGRVHVRRSILNRTEVQAGDTGTEIRFARWSRPRYRYEVSYNFLRSAAAYQEAQSVASFLVRHGGRRESFLFRDPEDYTVTYHGFGYGNGTSTKFPLQRVPVGTWTDLLGTWPTYTGLRTNFLLRSQEFDNASWGKAGSASANANAAIAPDGTATADTVNFPAEADYVGQVYSGSFTVGDVWTFSVWLKGTAGQTVRIAIESVGGVHEWNGSDVTLTASWQRYSVSFTLAEAGHTGLHFYVQRFTGQTAAILTAWGAQGERLQTTATPYIATTSATVTSYPAYWTVNQTTDALVAPSTREGWEPVTEPVWSGAIIYKDGVALTPVTDWTPTAGGLVTFAVAPASNTQLRWTGTYYKRVRFDEDDLDFDRIVDAIYSGEGVELVSVIA